MTELAVMIPTYKRPEALQSVASNLEKATKHSFKLYFGLEKEDELGIAAAKATGHEVIINKYAPGYANTIQTIYEQSKEPFLMHGNDDFLFLPNWDETPIAMFERADLMVVGIPQTEGDVYGSAISMFRRAYIKEMSGVVDMPNRVFYPYNHNYVDTEFTETAQSRSVWALCEKQVLIHQHPGFTGKPLDATYEKNQATAGKDQLTFESRRHLWGK